MQGQQAQTGTPQIEYGSARRIPANFCNLRHTNEEFIIDFGLSGADPATTKVDVDTSVIISPYTAKKLLMSLGTIVSNWEQHFGEIQTEIENRIIAGRPAPLGDPQPVQRPPLNPERMVPAPHKQFRGATPPIKTPSKNPNALVDSLVDFGLLGGAVKISATAPDDQPSPEEALRAMRDKAKLDAQIATDEPDLNSSPCIPADFNHEAADESS